MKLFLLAAGKQHESVANEHEDKRKKNDYPADLWVNAAKHVQHPGPDEDENDVHGENKDWAGGHCWKRANSEPIAVSDILKKNNHKRDHGDDKVELGGVAQGIVRFHDIHFFYFKKIFFFPQN